MYADFNRSLIITPQSAAVGGADLGFNNGAMPGYSASNLTLDSMNVVNLSYANYFDNSFSTSTVSYVNHIRSTIGLGVSAGYIFIPDIEDNRMLDSSEANTLRFDKDITLTNCSHIYFRTGLGFRYGSELPVQLSSGISLNASRIRLIDYNGYGVGIDIGSGLLIKKPGVSMVVLLENVIGSYTHWNSSYSEYGYPHVRVGFGWERSFDYLYGVLKAGYTSPDFLNNEGINNINIDESTNDLVIETPERNSISEQPGLLISGAKLGVEYKILNVLSLRAGLAQKQFSFGAGVSLLAQRAGVDFAYITHALSGTYQVSLEYRW
jgi:hypothetical protein